MKDPNCVDAVITGGTGSNSASRYQPVFLPDKFEAGTPNFIGIVGLSAGIDYLLETGLENLYAHKMELFRQCLKQLLTIEEIVIYGKQELYNKIPIILFCIKNFLPAQVCGILSEKYNITLRSGLHCAPLIHKAMNTFPNGGIRVSIGHSNTEEDIDYFIFALKSAISTLKEN